jgi:hypothetical protein
MLHALFAAIDGVCDKHRVEKIETIGDAYVAATGCTAAEEERSACVGRGDSVSSDRQLIIEAGAYTRSLLSSTQSLCMGYGVRVGVV